MTFDKILLDNFFKGEALSSMKELDKILDYRTECINNINDPSQTKFNSKDYEKFIDAYDEVIEIQESDGAQKSKTIRDLFSDYFENKTVIELGPGDNPIYREIFDLGADEYIPVEPFNSDRTIKNLVLFNSDRTIKNLVNPDKLVIEDGLSYLIKQEKESAIVVSFGVMCPELWSKPVYDYFRFLAKEIYRVTPKGSITVHVGDWLAYDPKIIFGDPGFKSVRSLDNEGTIMQMASPVQVWIKE